MAVTITTGAALIATLGESGGGSNADTTEEVSLNGNSVIEIDGVFYVLVYQNSGDMQWYSSSNSGASWSTAGSAFTPTHAGGGMSTLVVAHTIWVAYSIRFPGSNSHLYVNTFDTDILSWGTEQIFDCGDGDHAGTAMKVEGPYASHVRPDGSFVWLISDWLTSYHWIVTYDGTFHGPTQFTSGAPQLFESSIMEPGGDIHVFYGNGYGAPILYHQVFSALDVVGTPTAISYTGPDILSWSDIGLMWGYLKASVFYLPCGQKTAAYPTIFGQPAILYGNDGAWTMGALLDTDPSVSDYSVYLCSLQLINGSLIYYYRGISSDGSHLIDRVGYAPEGAHDNPGSWTWQTIYDLNSPSPAVSGQATPYTTVPLPIKGATTGLSQTATQSRMVTSLQNNDGDLFVTYLFSVLVSAVIAALHNTFE